ILRKCWISAIVTAIFLCFFKLFYFYISANRPQAVSLADFRRWDIETSQCLLSALLFNIRIFSVFAYHRCIDGIFVLFLNALSLGYFRFSFPARCCSFLFLVFCCAGIGFFNLAFIQAFFYCFTK